MREPSNGGGAFYKKMLKSFVGFYREAFFSLDEGEGLNSKIIVLYYIRKVNRKKSSGQGVSPYRR